MLKNFFIKITILTTVIFSSVLFSYAVDPAPAVAQPSTTGISIVQCGWEKPCSISDLIHSSSLLAQSIIKIFFPILFFAGGFISLLPIIKDPNVPENRAESKKRFKILLIGSSFMLGAYVIVSSVLSIMGLKTNVLDNVTSVNKTSVLNYVFDTSYAIYNPLSDVSVQAVLLKIANGVVFLAMIAGAYAVVRGGLYLVWSYQNPSEAGIASVQKAKWWIISGILVWVFFLGAEYFISIIYNTFNDFTSSVK